MRKFISRFFVLFLSWCEQIATVSHLFVFQKHSRHPLMESPLPPDHSNSLLKTFAVPSPHLSLCWHALHSTASSSWTSCHLKGGNEGALLVFQSGNLLSTSPPCSHKTSNTWRNWGLQLETSQTAPLSGIPCPSEHSQNLKMGLLPKSEQRDLKLNYGKPYYCHSGIKPWVGWKSQTWHPGPVL